MADRRGMVADQRRDPWVVVLAAVAAAGLVAGAWSRWDSVVDDAYISARYAEQLVAGHGLAYNAEGPPVEGYTNLLWTLLLALGRSLGAPIVPLMTDLGAAFGVLAAWGVVALARALGGRGYGIWVAALLLVASPHFLVVTTNGIESSMYVAGVVWTAWSVLAGPWWLGAVACGLLGTVRPEGAMVAGILAIGGAARAPRAGRSWAPVLAVGAGFALLEAWRHATYGAWLPNTWYAKLSRTWREEVAFDLAYLAPDWPVWAGLALAGALVPATFRRDPARWAVWAAALATVALAFRVDMWMPGGRLLQPACALLYALIAAEAGSVRWIAAVAGAWALALPLTPWGAHPARYDARNTVMPGNAAQRAAEHLAAHVPAGSWMATRDAGVLAYYVGTDVNVGELHERALTRPHPDGADADWRAATPPDPALILTTTQRKDSPRSPYRSDERALGGTSVPYQHLGRVEQHYHRYYDVWVRPDLGVPPLPEGLLQPPVALAPIARPPPGK